jgi:transcriptional regulator with XRE-family HTH domain
MFNTGSELREARNAAGLTIAQLATLLDVSNDHLGKVETGKLRLTRTFALASWHVLRCPRC